MTEMTYGWNLEMQIKAIQDGLRIREIPVNYRQRVGESSVTGDFWKAFKLGMRMIGLVLEYRLGLVRRARTVWKDRPRDRVASPDFGLNEDLVPLAKSLANGTTQPVPSRTGATAGTPTDYP